jgi:predicted phosphoribosyltransferase
MSVAALGLALTVVAGAVWPAPAWADFGWAAVARSPSREEVDWAWSAATSSFAAEAQALQNCAVKQNASDCVVVASGPNCVAVAWDVSEPLNRAHGGVGATREAALSAAAAGPHANDLAARCSTDPRPTL